MPFAIITPTTSWAAAERIATGEAMAVFFHQDGCGHCAYAREQIESVLDEFPVSVVAINITHDRRLFDKVGLDSTPCLALFVDDDFVGKIEGAQDAAEYVRFVSGGESEEESDESED